MGCKEAAGMGLCEAIQNSVSVSYSFPKPLKTSQSSYMCNFLELQALYWLPVQARMDYKLSTVCHNFFSDSCPAYFSDLLTVYTTSRQLRSSGTEDVRTKTFGKHCFSYGSPIYPSFLLCACVCVCVCVCVCARNTIL